MVTDKHYIQDDIQPIDFINQPLEINRSADIHGVIDSYSTLGDLARIAQNYREAVDYYNLAISECKPSPKYHERLYYLYNQLGVCFHSLLSLEEAVEAFDKALAYGEKSNKNLSTPYNNIGNIFLMLNQNDKAKSYYRKAILPAQENKDTSMWIGSLLNIGLSYKQEGLLDSCLNSFQLAYNLSKKTRFYREFVTVASNLSEQYINNRQFLLAGKILQEAREIPDSLLQEQEIIVRLIQRGRYHIAMKRYPLAERLLHEAMDHTKENKYLYFVTITELANLYEETQNYKSAFYYQKELYQWQDSFSKRNEQLKVNNLETKYATAQKDKIIAESNLLLSEQKRYLEKQKGWIWLIFFSSVLITFGFLWRYSHLRQKNKRLVNQMEVQELKATIKGEENERTRIAAELHDGVVSELTAIKMNLEVAGKRWDMLPDNFSYQLKELSRVINDIRSTAHKLMPEILLRHGLPEAIGIWIEQIENSSKLEIEYYHYGDFHMVDLALRQVVYRIIQELVHNILKHAKATKTLLQLSSHERLLSISLEDNGIGMTKKKTESNMGLEMIKRRVAEHNGKIEWQDGHIRGTLVYLEFEMNKNYEYDLFTLSET